MALAWKAEFQSRTLAKLAGLGERTLRRAFAAQFHTTPQRWLEARRMIEAERLLQQTPPPRTTELAAALFYRRASHFCRHFKESHGVTPQEWRP